MIKVRSRHITPLPDHRRGSPAVYLTGFTLSLALTVGAFLVASVHRQSDALVFSRGFVLGMLALFAVLQVVVQTLFFLHMSARRQVRFSVLSAVFTVMVVLTIVVGSLWIMQNLNYNMMPKDPLQYVQHEEGVAH